MESEDYHFYQGLVYLLENDVSTLGYDLTFSTEVLPPVVPLRGWPHLTMKEGRGFLEGMGEGLWYKG